MIFRAKVSWEDKMNLLKKAAYVAGIAALAASTALTATAGGHSTNLRIQTHFSEESPSGKLAAEFIDNIQTMSGGDITIEMYYSSSVVTSVETFDAAATGILDCDMTGGAYQVGKNPAFQFVGDIMGGYDSPWDQYSWLYNGGGYEAAQELYNKYDMQFIGWWIPGMESLSSSRPIRNAEDFKNWKFRSPPGLATMVFKNLGASPIVMDFTEIFTALETGIIDGADASNIAGNVSLGLYDIVKHTNYPGFHSMPSDHLACNKAVWDGMSDSHRKIISVAMESLAFKTSMQNAKKMTAAASEMKAAGVNLYDWTAEDRASFRAAAQSAWTEFATTPEAKALLATHVSYLKELGLVD
jgi:TRAP-type C4-dicarboxylate transport system substrate-binding protein